MKKYTIKYETYDGDVEIQRVTAYDRQNAIDALINCKLVYWVKPDLK